MRRPKRLLSGLLRCAQCGGGMSMHDRTGDAIRIRCSRSKESGTCSNQRRYSLNRIETAVVAVAGQLMHPELLAEYVRVYREERRDEAAKAGGGRAANERRLTDLNGQLERLMQALARGVLPIEAVEAQYKPLEIERDRVAAELEQMPASTAIELHRMQQTSTARPWRTSPSVWTILTPAQTPKPSHAFRQPGRQRHRS
ncbi:hypothetical protein F2981_02700 [Sinorhizobium meliloti]|nr:hypothetical protein [Sinorhizobium meliloti]